MKNLRLQLHSSFFSFSLFSLILSLFFFYSYDEHISYTNTFFPVHTEISELPPLTGTGSSLSITIQSP